MASIETADYHSDDIKRFKLSCGCCSNQDSILKKIKLNPNSLLPFKLIL